MEGCIQMEFQKTFKSLPKSQVELEVTVNKDDVRTHYDGIITKYVKELQIPGFRKGKVPVQVLEQKYGEALRAEASSDLIEKVLEEIFRDANEYERPLPYSYPDMKEVPEFNTEKDFQFAVTYDVLPKIEIKKIDGFSFTIPEVTISEEDIQEELKDIQQRNALVIDRADTDLAEKDNIATIDYSELDEEDTVIEGSERQSFTFTIGTEQNLFKLDDDVIGMKKGESKDVTKTYPEDDPNKELAGKTKKIRVKLAALKRRDLPAIDDDLAQDVNEKFSTLQDMKDDIKKNLEKSVENKLNQTKIEAFLKEAVKENSFDLPESMVLTELESRWIMTARQFGMDPAQLEKLMGATENTKASTMSAWRPEAEERLKARIIVETLLKDRNISITPEEIEAEYKKIAENASIKEEEVKAHYESDLREKELLIEDLKETKLYDQLFEKCTFTTSKKLSAKEFFEKGHTHE
ncbi:trigger factor [Treponema phagedenis]|uniref:Trigger factor n=2 Tax=Treponema phagedenis TaxID=162 RepID=A0AAE6M8H5_TREPH|nr:trigger factor [Treponema phagedenis]QEJ97622.1 trigger factor [Treponema phagedenis]QEK00590.1 trigger factor [Treponema phagedenis]QEK03191.1 trigger factor [Treponema phagedenis]QEK05599.1 trigger factor [Treponema phagedenis]